ncbi:RNA-directed DNA polymerase, eukaryota, reverse transcriptase zinc-binding domain protein [Tanacetum coccineum]
MELPHHLNSIQQADMEAEVSNEEIKRAVWDCGIDKSPGPDGFTFGFYRHFWKLIDKDVMAAVKHFFHSGFIPKGVNSSFIALIPKSPDAKMVKEFRPISLIGSLYKIIAKILANRLVMVLGNIVNEVQSVFVADRQILDGPFILNEIFQWCKLKKKHSFIFKVDFEKAYDSVCWDYLDDVLKRFGFGERWCGWIQEYLRSSWGSVIVNGSPTEEFQIFKGLKQSSLSFSIYFDYGKSSHFISKSRGCGSEGGGSMSRIQSWNEIVDKMIDRLSKWKMKTLSIGGRLTLLKSVIFEARVTKAIHGEDGKIGKRSKAGHASTWCDIVQEIDAFKQHGTDLYSFMQKKLGDGANTSFWEDVWCENTVLKDKYPRLYALELNKNIKIEGVSLGTMIDRWTWALEGSGDFSVASVRKLIDDRRLPVVSSKIRWIKAVSIKVNVLAWKVSLDCLPTRLNISRKEILFERFVIGGMWVS